MPEPTEPETTDYRERDAASIKILGFFFTLLGVLVLVGTFWTLHNIRAVTVNLASGAVLTLVGLGMMYFARRKPDEDQQR